MAIIEMYAVSKSYPNGVDALKDVTLKIGDGEFVFMAGPSGAGKTTLMKLFLCLERATSGQILVGGRNIHTLRRSSIPYLRRNIGMVFQDFRLLHNRTVFDNVAIALEILGLPRREIVPRVHQTLESVGLGRYLRELPQSLSGGEQQRVAIARALVNEPAILLADEPTGNLDPKLSLEIVNLLVDIHRKGTTVLVATHNTQILEKVPMRTITLNKGVLTGDRAADGRNLLGQKLEPAPVQELLDEDLMPDEAETVGGGR
jgi:cell division transport system ATP-binding protein